MVKKKKKTIIVGLNLGRVVVALVEVGSEGGGGVIFQVDHNSRFSSRLHEV